MEYHVSSLGCYIFGHSKCKLVAPCVEESKTTEPSSQYENLINLQALSFLRRYRICHVDNFFHFSYKKRKIQQDSFSWRVQLTLLFPIDN